MEFSLGTSDPLTPALKWNNTRDGTIPIRNRDPPGGLLPLGSLLPLAPKAFGVAGGEGENGGSVKTRPLPPPQVQASFSPKPLSADQNVMAGPRHGKYTVLGQRPPAADSSRKVREEREGSTECYRRAERLGAGRVEGLGLVRPAVFVLIP